MSNTKEKNIGVCLLCNQKKSLINAHVLSRSYEKFLRDENRKILKVSLDGQERPVETLPFIKNLFCAECDGSFADPEKELAEFSDDLFNQRLMAEGVDGKHISVGDILSDQTVLVRGFDVSKIKWALLFLLYKFSLDPRCGVFDLGISYEHILKGILCSRNFDDVDVGISLSHYLKSEKIPRGDHKRVLSVPKVHQFEYVTFVSVLLPCALEVTYRVSQRFLCGCKMGFKFPGGFCGCKREINHDSDYLCLLVSTDGFAFDSHYYSEMVDIMQRMDMFQRYPVLGSV